MPDSSIRTRLLVFSSAFIVAAVTALPILAADTPSNQQSNVTRPDNKASETMVRQSVPVDPSNEPAVETDLGRMLRRAAGGPRIELMPDGSTRAILAGRLPSVLVMRPGPEGKPQLSCVSSEEAEATLKPDSPAADEKKEP